MNRYDSSSYIYFIVGFIQGTVTKKSTWIDYHFPKNRRIDLQQIREKFFITRGQVWSYLYTLDSLLTKIRQHIYTAADGKALPSGRIIRLTPFFFNHLFIIVRCIIYKPL